MSPLMQMFSKLSLVLSAIILLHHQIQALPVDGTKDNKIRVLYVNDLNSQHALEEAASLSLDLPNNEASSLNRSSSSVGSNGYHHISLASLTLSQRGLRREANADVEDNNNRTTSQEVAPKNNNHHQQSSTPTLKPPPPVDPWKQLYLPRIKPSWLNVSQQFKITGNSIQEIEYMMPQEYFLRTAFDSPILLKTKLGILEGVRSIKFNKHLYTFLSVPYAKPPIGDLRFKLPRPAEKWDGILQATKWPPFCVQPSMTLASRSSPVHVLTQIMSEDCLYLNIWSPSLKFNKNHKRPVLLWIPGGAFQYGGISVDENDGSALALLGDVVVVTLNYRVSAFGFLNANNPQNGPNNVGMFDQRLAMEWVQENIRQFGGDPQQVTLFGESAGGHSVGLHMISPGSYHLFKRAILQSGVPISYLRSYDVNTDNTGATIGEGTSSVMMAKRLKCYFPNTNYNSSSNNSSSSSADTTTAASATTTAPETTSSLTNNETTIGTRIYINETMNTSNENDTLDSEEDTYDTVILNDLSLECMRNKSSLEILKAMGAPGNAGFFPTGNDLKGFFPNGPVMQSFDPDNLKVGPQKDFLIGTTTDEGTFMLHYGMPKVFPSKTPPTVDNIEALKEAMTKEIERMSKSNSVFHLNRSDIDSATGQNGGAQAHLYKPLLRTSSSVLEGFMPKNSQVKVLENGTVIGNTTAYNKEAEFGKHIGSLITDIIFLCPARSLARTLAESGRNVYFYLYTHRNSQSPYHDWIGVTHHDDVEFVFGRPLRMADVHTGKDIEMSQRMIKSWSHFAYTGQMLDQIGVKWPKYGIDDGQYMSLAADNASVGERYHDRVCNIYDTIISVHLQDS